MASRTDEAPSPRKFTRDEYYRMGDAGLFQDERVELLDGVIVKMSPQQCLHASVLTRINELLHRQLAQTFTLRFQLPIVLNDFSEPEPDVAVCVRRPDGYRSEHPLSSQVLLVIEVADSSLAYDRGQKAAAYAASGIPNYWIVNVVDDVVEASSEPDPGARRYARTQIARHGTELTLPGGSVIDVTVLLPCAERD